MMEISMKAWLDSFKQWFDFGVLWLKNLDPAVFFASTVAFLVLLRIAGAANLSTFVALIYIMWFVSVEKKQ